MQTQMTTKYKEPCHLKLYHIWRLRGTCFIPRIYNLVWHNCIF